MMKAPVEFWFEFASTYSYPAAMRVEAMAASSGVELHYEPFLLGPIFVSQGWQDSPFNLYPAKGRYMWRDLDRICGDLGLPFKKPSVFPRSGLAAARVALVGAKEAWGPAFVRAVYGANFADDRDVSRPEVIAEILTDLSLDGAVILERSNARANKDLLRSQTEEATRREVFGSPSFVVQGELFWGNDRLEQAFASARRSGLP
jgi:2-hydroxychromene-2-carboxylate isomerase